MRKLNSHILETTKRRKGNIETVGFKPSTQRLRVELTTSQTSIATGTIFTEIWSIKCWIFETFRKFNIFVICVSRISHSLETYEAVTEIIKAIPKDALKSDSNN